MMNSKSPFKHVLRTNYVPTPAEIRQIGDYLLQPIQTLSRLEAEISRMQAIVEDLSRERDKVKEVVDAHRAMLSPIRRLPVTVMQRIFVYCVSSKRYPVLHISEAPTLLGHICSGWRTIALAMPLLWSTVHIAVSNYDPAHPETASQVLLKREAIKTWLDRSGELALGISLCVSRHGIHSDLSASIPLLELLATYSRRWKHLRLQVPSTSLAPFIRLTSEDIPLLESFIVEDYLSHVSMEQSGWSDKLIFLQHAPRLCSLSAIRFEGNTHLPATPWWQLTRLCIESDSAFFFLDTYQLLELLRLCRNLRVCTLKIPHPDDNNLVSDFLPLPTGPINLPHLYAFSIKANQYRARKISLADIFDNIVLPNLRDIQITGNYGPPHLVPEFLTSFKSLLNRSSCRLRKLVLQILRINKEALVSCLQLMPNLKVFNVVDYRDQEPGNSSECILHDDILLLLTPTQDSVDRLCPNLESIQFSQSMYISDNVLLSFLKARWAANSGIARLRNAEIFFNRQIGPEARAEIQLLVDEGFIFRGHYEHVWRHPEASPWEGLPYLLV